MASHPHHGGHLPPIPTHESFLQQHRPFSRLSQYNTHNSSTAIPEPTTSAAPTDPYLRIALLEKDLEYYQVARAEAEIAVQCLAKLTANGAQRGGDEDGRVVLLQQRLAESEKSKQDLATKLDNALEIIATMARFKMNGSAAQAVAIPESVQSSNTAVQTGELIDLQGTNGDSDNTLISEKGTAASDDFEDVSSVDMDDIETPTPIRTVWKEDFPDSPYKYHFTNLKDDGDSHEREPPKALGKDAGYKRPERTLLNTSTEGSSDSSIEPNSGSSCQGCVTPSEGPTSLTTSFSSSNNTFASGERVTTKKLNARETLNAQMLALHNWNSLKYANPPSDLEEQSQTTRPVRESPAVKVNNIPGPTIAARKPGLVGSEWNHHRLISTEEQRQRSMAIHRHEVQTDGLYPINCPEFFKYGIRFEPDPIETNVYRTVVINGLTSDTTLGQVLPKVRGGMVIEAQLLNTMEILGCNSVLVVFLHEDGAMSYDEYTKQHSIVINNRRLGVNTVPTPTYPINPRVKTRIEVHKQTRCLEVRNFPRHISPSQLQRDLQGHDLQGPRPVHLNMRTDGVLELGFASINHAGRAFGMLTTFRAYIGSRTSFVPDPCAQPVETLLESQVQHDEYLTTLEVAAAVALPEDFDVASDAEPAIMVEDGQVPLGQGWNSGLLPKL